MIWRSQCGAVQRAGWKPKTTNESYIIICNNHPHEWKYLKQQTHCTLKMLQITPVLFDQANYRVNYFLTILNVLNLIPIDLNQLIPWKITLTSLFHIWLNWCKGRVWASSNKIERWLHNTVNRWRLYDVNECILAQWSTL